MTNKFYKPLSSPLFSLIHTLMCGCEIQNQNLYLACSESHKLAWVHGKHPFQLTKPLLENK